MKEYMKWVVVAIGLGLAGTMWVVAKQSEDLATLARTIEQDKREVKALEAELKRADQALGVKLQNSELERDRMDRLIADQIANMLQSLDNLATGVREMHQEFTMHRQGHEDLAKSREALTEAEAKVTAVESAVRALVIALEESRRAAAGVSNGNVTVLAPEDQVLSAIEVGNIVDRLDREIRALKDQLAEARLLEQDILQNQAHEAEEGR